MKVCYFGIYDSSYARNRILIDGLRQNGVDVIECQSRASGFYKYLDLVKNHRKIKDGYDVMVVGFPGYQAMILARFLAMPFGRQARKPIFFDCFTSLYDSMVLDRKQARRWSTRAVYLWLLDWLSMRLADKILFDTQAHIDYVAQEFHIPKEKCRRLWIGADTSIFFPRSSENYFEQNGIKPRMFSVLFFGTFIPLQGIEYIVGAAKRLSEECVNFSIVGNGQMKKKILHIAETLKIKNVSFIDFLSHEALVEKIAAADTCLGIFGNTNKTKRVIPNKVYECLAMKKPVITADTPAARELLSDNDVCFVKTADSASLAAAILRLKNDRKAMEKVAQNGYDTFIKNATPQILGKELRKVIGELIR